MGEKKRLETGGTVLGEPTVHHSISWPPIPGGEKPHSRKRAKKKNASFLSGVIFGVRKIGKRVKDEPGDPRGGGVNFQKLRMQKTSTHLAKGEKARQKESEDRGGKKRRQTRA